MSLRFSPSGRKLLVAAADNVASIWNVPNETTWPSTPHVTLYGHTSEVSCGAFLGDETHVITGSYDRTIAVWRTYDREQTANFDHDERV